MGHGDSKMSNSASYPNLDLKQVEEIKRHFGKAGEMKKDAFVTWQSRLGGLAGILFDALAEKGLLKQAIFLEAANKLGGDADDAATVLLRIHGSTKKMLATVVEFFAETHKSPNGDVLLHFLYKDVPNDDSRLSNYLISTPLAVAIIRSSYSSLWNGNRDDLLPRLTGDSEILTSACSLALINSHLPMERRRIWSLLFSSTQHGSSFSQLHKRISGEGPCLIVIRSTANRVFGCFASDGFLSGPQYRGDATSFLFQLAPEMNVFFATGKSENYAYLNCQQETLPNGLGVGGFADVWPFFIHEEYGKGLSARSISSFDKCCIAGDDTFEIKDMEVWRVGRKRQLTIEEGERVRSPKSIIDKDPEAKALLEMAGRSMHSEAYRDPAPILDEEDQWQQ